MKIILTFLMLANIAVAGGEETVISNSSEPQKNCPCPPKPKPKVPAVHRLSFPKEREPQQKQYQDQDNEQHQNQRQTVNVHVHNQDHYRLAARLASAARSRFKLGLHAGCGPVGVKRTEVSSNSYRYDLRNDLVIGGSVSIRVLGPVWLTGQAFSNRLYTGGLEFEF